MPSLALNPPVNDSLASLCTPRTSVFQGSKNDTALDLTDFLNGTISIDFLDENFFTDGLNQLVRFGLRRLAGKSDQGIFILSQSMGGGKTHGMITLGLLAQNPEIRKNIWAITTIQVPNRVMSG